MKIIEKIKEPIAKEFEIFETEFKNSVNSGILILNVILKFMINRKGKQVRPILVLLFAKMHSSENLTEKSYRSAIISELIHSATLIHDDVIDSSNMRRGFFSLNALWKNKIDLLANEFLSGRAVIEPTLNQETCKNCDLSSLCRIRECDFENDEEEL